MGAGPRSEAFFGSGPSARDSASACAMACARSRTQLSSTTSKSSPTVATARSGTLPISVNLPRPSSASRASAAGTRPTWSCPLLRSFTTSAGDLAAAATDLVSGQQADHLEQRVARGQRHVFRFVAERAQEVVGVHVNPQLRSHHDAGGLHRNAHRGDELVRRELLQDTSRVALEPWPVAHGRGLTLADVDLHGDDGVHLDGGAGDLAVPLRTVHVADRQTADVDEASDEHRRYLY